MSRKSVTSKETKCLLNLVDKAIFYSWEKNTHTLVWNCEKKIRTRPNCDVAGFDLVTWWQQNYTKTCMNIKVTSVFVVIQPSSWNVVVLVPLMSCLTFICTLRIHHHPADGPQRIPARVRQSSAGNRPERARCIGGLANLLLWWGWGRGGTRPSSHGTSTQNFASISSQEVLIWPLSIYSAIHPTPKFSEQ